MKSISELLNNLHSLDVKIWVDGNTLRYSAPKETLTPDLLNQLRERKAEILAFLQKNNTAANSNLTPILPVRRDKNLPLSFAQQRLWFLEQFEPNGSTYCIASVYRLTKALNVSALEQSLNELVRRHEILRTTFSTVDGQPVQVISPETPLTLPLINLLELPPNQREAEARRQATQEAQHPFDLAQGPLFRAKLLRLTEQEHILLLNMHHIICDGWSFDVSFQELAALYEAFANNKPSPLPKLPIQYADFTVWQRDWFQGDVIKSQIDYWRQQLSGELSVLQLPTDYPRPPVKTSQGSHQSLELPQDLTKALKALSQQEGVTLFMTLLATFQTLLSRYSAQSDIVVGTPIANRNQVETERLIGFFVNTLVLRTDLSGNPSFRELLGRVRKVALEAYAHQDLPFEKLLEELQPERDQSRTPLFQVMFAFQKASRQALELPGLTVTPLKVHTGTAKFDLTLELQEMSEDIRGQFEYNTDLFDSATIAQMACHFQTLLEGIVADPEQRLSNLPLLTLTEQHQLLVEWNDTQADYPNNTCIHQLFEAQVEQTPDAVAVVFENKQLTYHELNCRANQVAHHLRSLGLGPDNLVGICVERSLEMVVGLLGILKAGGTYVPLDPAYPSKRLTFMLEDSRAPVLLTQQGVVALLPTSGTHIVYLDADSDAIARKSQSNPTSNVTGNNLAYTIYTSGSTGKPKGVQILHSAVVNFLTSMRRFPGLTDADTLLSLTTLSFDIAALEIFLPLSVGARLVMVSRSVANDGTQLLERLNDCDPTVMQATPATWRLLLSAGWSGSPQMKILCGGEALSRELANQLLEKGASLWNLYGPTEATIWSTLDRVDNTEGTVSIGRPIANTQIYLLDEHLQPVPVGVPGELYIGGAGLARGYLNRPELTAQKFIANPLSHEPKARLYKTGDLARYRSDGNIEYLGRIDHQVKGRGFRIELGEIEAVLSQHPVVQQSVVIVREDIPGNQQLVAYLVPHKEQAPPTASELRHFLKQQLPEYMVPSAFVQLEALPLTPNGKIDRRVLPAPDTTRPFGEKGYVAPQTPVEEMVAGIWAQVLAVKQISIHDNFFELGGHSLLATQLISRVRDTFNVEFPLRGLFESPTVASLSERLEALRRTQPGLVAPPLLRVSREGELLLSFAQARLWFLEQLAPGSSTYNIPSAVRLTGSLDVAALKQSLNEIVERHETLRTTFGMVNGEPIQVIAPVLVLTLPLVDLRDVPEATQQAEVERLAEESAQQPFDLAIGPLLRVKLLHLGEAEHVLLLTMHHIVSDGWSMGVLIRELAALYEAFLRGKPSPLPQLPIQYADFGHWQRQWLQSEVLAAQLSYWQQQLTGAQTVLELPTDRPRPAVQTFCGATQFVALPEPLSQKLKTLSQRAGVTLFMTLLAAFETLLYRYTGQEDICIGSPIANRNRSETENLIGFFVNTLVLRTELSENLSFQELLGRVREVTLSAYAHQDLPFEQLVEALGPERSLSHHPLFQVMFALENAPMPALELPDLTISSLKIESSTAKFDLTLSMEDTEQGLVGSLEYNTDLFDAATISRMLGHFQTLLEGIVNNPEQRLSDLPMLTQLERQQLLVEWNDTQVPYPKDICIHQLFEAQAEQTPEAVAVVFEDQQLTYHELNRRANQVAHHLRSLGLGPDTLVGICVERSLELVVGLLGILKAGAAYVPLDPTYPSERLAFMLCDIQVSVLLTQQQLIEKLPSHNPQVVCLDTDWKVINKNSQENPTSCVTADNLAYVMYTSGSTGKPKGVSVIHRGVVRLVKETNYANLSTEEVFLQLAPISFDASTFEIWGCLLNAAKLVIMPPHTPSLEELGQVIQQYKITTLWLTTGLFHLMVDERLEDLKPLRQLLAGGDVLSVPHVQKFLQNIGNCKLINGYGPTENTTFTCCYQITEPDQFGSSVPIGRPITNTQVYVLDSHLQPVPVGVPGELYIGGDGLARGYLNHLDLTEENFLQNPFSDEPRARLYKTGDLVRYLSDGNIEFLGRLDHQVKIRGFRIELGEIEAVLAQYSTVLQTVVTAREDMLDGKRLVAYVVPNQEQAPTVDELRRFLKQKLPSYMVPSTFVLLDTLPLTPSGKVDRRVLPAPDQLRQEPEETFIAPHDELELQLTKIWEKVLGIQHISVQDNFFDLGGHSMLAARLFAQIEKKLGKNLPLATLFQAPTIEELASIIRQKGWSAPWQALVAIQSGRSKLPLFCVHPPGGNILCYRDLAHYLDKDRPVYGLQAIGLDGKQAPYKRAEDMAAHYIREIRGFQPEGPYLLAGHSGAGIVAFEMAQQLVAQGQKVALLALLDAYSPQLLAREVSLCRTLYINFLNLLRLRPEDKLPYIKQRAQWLRGRIANKIAKTFNLWMRCPSKEDSHPYALVTEAFSQAMRDYVPQVYPGQATLFRTRHQPTAVYYNPQLGWSSLVVGGLEIYDVPGLHLTVLEEPHVQVLAEKLRACIDEALEDVLEDRNCEPKNSTTEVTR